MIHSYQQGLRGLHYRLCLKFVYIRWDYPLSAIISGIVTVNISGFFKLINDDDDFVLDYLNVGCVLFYGFF